MDDLFSDAVAQLLGDVSTPAAVRAIEAGGDHRPLWQAIDDAGFADALVDEASGGAGLALADVFGVLALCGTHALPVPLGETLLARALLARAGVARPPGSIVFAEAEAEAGTANASTSATGTEAVTEAGTDTAKASNTGTGTGTGTGTSMATDTAASGVVCPLVRHGRVAEHALVARGGAVRLLPVAQASRSAAGFALDAALHWPEAAWHAAPAVPGTAHDLRTLQACVYAAQLAGALMAVFQRTLAHANERQQFGRPIGKFQAIQHQLSVMAEHAFAARMAAQIGCRAQGLLPERLNVAIAKARTSEAALEVAGIAHSIHGAIGFTAEFDLQLYTRRLHAWRQAAGSESYWHGVAGRVHLDSGHGLVVDTLRAATTLP